MHRPVAAALAAVASGLTLSLATPAWACGCGAYMPDRPGAAVADERAMLTWDGATEDIVMSLGISGASEKAAWVMPVPSAAQVTLGDAEVFTELGRLTAPRIEYRQSYWPTFTWLFPGAAAPDTAGAPRGAAVDVLSTQRIGPFDVTRIAAHDSTALANWLADKGFPNPDDLEENLATYVADDWEVVAIQLSPGERAQSLTGDLQPLRLSFASDDLVYPMRLSRSASMPQNVDLYVVADHRMDATATPVSGVQPTLQFAGRIERAAVSPSLAPYVGDKAFLTRWTDNIYDPAAIDGDYVFDRAATDAAFQHVIFRTVNRGDLTGVLLLALIVAGGVGLAAVLGRRVTRR